MRWNEQAPAEQTWMVPEALSISAAVDCTHGGGRTSVRPGLYNSTVMCPEHVLRAAHNHVPSPSSAKVVLPFPATTGLSQLEGMPHVFCLCKVGLTELKRSKTATESSKIMAIKKKKNHKLRFLGPPRP